MKIYQSLPLGNVRITDEFWSSLIIKMQDKMIPYQWEIINDNVPDAEKSYCINNFEIAAGLKQGKFGGMLFQDTDMAKWLEAVAYSLQLRPDEELEKKADYCISLLEKAQQKDGYINTFFTLVKPENKWTNLLEGHELYTAGHFIEAAVAYYHATKKDKFLNIMCKFADLICEKFGTNEGQIKGYPGHQEIELALYKLYKLTNKHEYLQTAKYFIDERGKKPSYFLDELERNKDKFHMHIEEMTKLEYSQSHLPVREQKDAVGHSVRATYMYCAMLDIACETNDAELLKSCENLFESMVQKRMYITGGIGSSATGECFTSDYDLPNDNCYCETCASIGLALFALRLANATGKSYYADIMEKALYNTVISGVSQNFTEFFYVNPLESIPKIFKENYMYNHVKTSRQKWFDVACCPTNIARTLGSLGQYICSENDDSLTINLFMTTKIEMQEYNVSINSSYIKNGKVEIITSDNFSKQLRIRVPSHSGLKSFALNGVKSTPTTNNGYIVIENRGKLIVEIELDVKPTFMYTNTKVAGNTGKVALTYGPLVYCCEQVDNCENLASLAVDTGCELELKYDEFDFAEMPSITAMGVKEDAVDMLYTSAVPKKISTKIKFVPYFYWNNRGEGEMLVWVRKNS